MPVGSPVTEQRRQRILWVLWVHGAGTPASITALLKSHVEGGLDWPEADWPGARQDPYECGIRQHLDAMATGAPRRVVRTRGRSCTLYDWNREVLQPRAHARDVLELRCQAVSNDQIARNLGIVPSLVSALYNDPFGFREKERKKAYCGGCGARKDAEQTICLNCVKKKREEREDRAESLLPDEIWARSLKLNFRVDFLVTDDACRLLVVHTERGKIERALCRGETWEYALQQTGAIG